MCNSLFPQMCWSISTFWWRIYKANYDAQKGCLGIRWWSSMFPLLHINLHCYRALLIPIHSSQNNHALSNLKCDYRSSQLCHLQSCEAIHSWLQYVDVDEQDRSCPSIQKPLHSMRSNTVEATSTEPPSHSPAVPSLRRSKSLPTLDVLRKLCPKANLIQNKLDTVADGVILSAINPGHFVSGRMSLLAQASSASADSKCSRDRTRKADTNTRLEGHGTSEGDRELERQSAFKNSVMDIIDKSQTPLLLQRRIQFHKSFRSCLHGTTKAEAPVW